MKSTLPAFAISSLSNGCGTQASHSRINRMTNVGSRHDHEHNCRVRLSDLDSIGSGMRERLIVRSNTFNACALDLANRDECVNPVVRTGHPKFWGPAGWERV